MKYEFLALLLHFLALLILILTTPHSCALNNTEILVSPTVFRILLFYTLLFTWPNMIMKLFEMVKVKFISSTCNCFPDVDDITLLESVTEKLSQDLFEPWQINWFICESCHKFESFISRSKFKGDKIYELLAMLWFPVEWTENSNKIIL